MEIHKQVGIFASLVAGSVLATSVSAASVDFRVGAPWNGGGNTITDGFVTVQSTPTGISWEEDGIGVSGGDPSVIDEVDNNETLTVSFAQPVTITSIWLDDFWSNTFNGGPDQARVTVNGVTQLLTATIPNPGDVTMPTILDFATFFPSVGPVATMLFEATGINANSSAAGDYALARIDFDRVAPVPVPPAFWLLGSAMVFLFRKRQTS